MCDVLVLSMCFEHFVYVCVCVCMCVCVVVKPQVEAIMKRDGVTYEEAKVISYTCGMNGECPITTVSHPQTKLLSGQPTGEFVMPSEVSVAFSRINTHEWSVQ